jgi:hypothetical protein
LDGRLFGWLGVETTVKYQNHTEGDILFKPDHEFQALKRI